MNGFFNVLKPVGATASDVVVCLKYALHEKKIGHLGTLDPGASGVLPIAVGLGTRLFNFLTNKIKYYRAFLTFGKSTDTLDAYGSVVQTCSEIPSQETLREVLKTFVGNLKQTPPAYSAISVGGVRSYKLARQGESVELKPRDVTVYDIELVRQASDDTFVVDIKCSGGTYIRSLARDIATRCGTVGYMSGLIRLASGCFDIKDAYTIAEIKEKKESCLLDIRFPLSDVEDYIVDDDKWEDLNNGRRVKAENFDGYRKIFCKDVFFGLAKSQKGYLVLDYYLKNAQ